MTTKILSPLEAIKSFCKTCNGEENEDYDCLQHDCTLYPWKQGIGIFEELNQTPKEEQKRQLRSERMKKAWITRRSKIS